MRKKLLLIIIIELLFGMNSCYAESLHNSTCDSIDSVSISEKLLDIIDGFSDYFDNLYMDIIQTNGDSFVDKQSHKNDCSWLIEFDSVDDTLWILLTIIDPLIETLVHEQFIISEDMIPVIAFCGASRDGTRVYMEASNFANDLCTPISKVPYRNKESSYFTYGLIVGRYYYYNNTFVRLPLIIENEIEVSNDKGEHSPK